MFQLGYAVLELTPTELYALTPGEFADQLEALNWLKRTQERHTRGPMTAEQRRAELAKLDARMKRAEAQKE